MVTFYKIQLKQFPIHSYAFCIVKVYILNFSQYILIGFENNFIKKDRAYNALQYCCLLILRTIMILCNKI